MREWFFCRLFGPTERERSAHGAEGASQQPKGARFNEYLDHFVRMPEMLAEIEFYFALTMLGMAENLLSLLLLPLKCIVAFSRLERRDVVALALITVGILTYYALSLYTTQLYAYLYHVVRRTSFIKLVMVFNILDVADRLLSALSQEVIEVLTMCVQNWGKKEPPRRGPGVVLAHSLWLPVGSAVLSVVCVAVHAVTLLLSVVTLNVAVNAEGHLLLALMVGTNLSEVKGVAYKKHNRESLLQVTAADAVERLKFVLFVLVMVLQHMHERFHVLDIADMLLVFLAEVFVDFTKHLFVAKFNGISLSVYRSYSQLTILDMAAETVLWRLGANIHIRCTDDPLLHVDNVKALLSASDGFFPKHVRRTGFIPVPYAALLLWSVYPFASLMLLRAPLMFALSLTVVVLLKLLLSEFLRGVAARFVVRSLIVLQHSEPRRGGCEAAGILFGVSPLDTPSLAPLHCGPEGGEGGSVATLQLTSFLCALLALEPFDLQAGKVKK
ncbi:putative membrane receptor protein [Trypanosoma conorhini]|uniref:Putative membrane receptor protein n=1 Tax=Trypanosoma conorhini TaxID=83891 RepID=A0A3R7NS28_9TRYP|nr:putative membrane receptor protein [Trypanosoma conorhini]RNF26193.1 putative membrane receptor protein [Trypanosoma conorhini]